eukprot:gene5160-5679_t
MMYRPTAAVRTFSTVSNQRIFASPLAKKILKEAGKEVESVYQVLGGKGSGGNNRLTEKDVLQALPLLGQVTTAAPTTVAAPVPAAAAVAQSAPAVTTTTTTTASSPEQQFHLSTETVSFVQRLALSKQTVPHYYLSTDLNLHALLQLRTRLNKKLEKQEVVLSITDFLVKAAALAMRHVPDLNASWMDSFVRRYDQVDINLVSGSKVGGEGGSLLSDVASKGLAQLAEEITAAEQTASQIYRPGTFTIHNLGVYGTKTAAVIINPPQAAALALGSIHETVVVAEKPATATEKASSGWAVAPVLTATLACDHRVVDGALAAQWMAAFKQLVEDPDQLLL